MMPKKLWRAIGQPSLLVDYLQQTEERYNWYHWYHLQSFRLASMSLLFYECYLIVVVIDLAQLLYYFFLLLFQHAQKEQRWIFFVLTDHRKFFAQSTMNLCAKYFLIYLIVTG